MTQQSILHVVVNWEVFTINLPLACFDISVTSGSFVVKYITVTVFGGNRSASG